ncbi:hypothetical protein BH09PAT1_BH09PAT1_7460 [soil metagenome]
MAFFTDSTEFSHRGSFYGIPVYLNTNENNPVISGTNIIYDWLFLSMALFHNVVIERCTQALAAILNLDYQAGFPFKIKSELKK